MPFGERDLAVESYRSWNRAQMATRWGRNHLHRLALVDDGKVVASAKRYDLQVVAGDRTVPAVGVGAVFTPPAWRGRGHARQLVDLMLADAADRGCRYALLFSEIGAAYYESMGFHDRPAIARVHRRRHQSRSAGDVCAIRHGSTICRSSRRFRRGTARARRSRSSDRPIRLRFSSRGDACWLALVRRIIASAEFFVERRRPSPCRVCVHHARSARRRARRVRRSRSVGRARRRDASGARGPHAGRADRAWRSAGCRPPSGRRRFAWSMKSRRPRS